MSDPSLPFAATRDGIRVAIRVTPRAARNHIGEVALGADGDAMLKVSVSAVPDKGKANDAVIKLLAKEWRVPKTSISVASGATDRRKTLLLAGDPATLETRLRFWLEQHNG